MVRMPDDPDDDDALRWDGDETVTARPQRVAGADAVEDPEADEGDEAGAGFGAVGTALFGAIALLEAIAWGQATFLGPIASTASPGTGSFLEMSGFVLTLLTRAMAVAGPLLWFGLAVVRIRPGRRLPWLVLGTLLFLPWPTLVRVL